MTRTPGSRSLPVALLALLPALAGCPSSTSGDDGGGDSGAACTVDSCASGQYCDAATGACLPGCDQPTDCAVNESCTTATHTCDCAAGYHACNGTCARNDDVATCGDRCDACPGDPNGTATCAAATCGLSCNTGTQECAGACATCPAGNTATQCNGAACEATACASGRRVCQGACPTCPSGATATHCNGAACEATACGTGALLCQGQCPSCPAGSATTQCSGASCQATSCGAGRLLCGGQCPTCPSQATATACAGTQCVATTCGSGYELCGGACVACAAGQLFCCKEVVQDSPMSGPEHALALDPSGAAVVAFRDAAQGSVKLARRATGGFSIITVDTGDVGYGVSLAVDPNGVAHLAYSNGAYPYVIRYARVPVSGAATVETVESSGLIAAGATAIAVDDTGAVHVAAYASGDAHYATRDSNGWHPRFAMYDGQQISLAVSGTTPQIVASSNPSSGVQASVLTYGLFDPSAGDGGAFVTSTVNSTVGVSAFHDATLALDSNGTPWVAWQHPNYRDLHLSVRDGGSWSSQVVDPTIAGATSLKWFNGPRIAYVGTSNFVPRYAEATDAGWLLMTIDNKSISVGTVSLAIDATGRPHVTLYDPDPSVQRVYYLH